MAYELDRVWRGQGQASSMMACSFAEPHPAAQPVARWLAGLPTRGAARHAGRAIAMPAFAIAATRQLRALRRQRHDMVFLSHGDTLDGDVCVVHAVNRASLQAKRAAGEWRWRLNPMHGWVGWRDRLAIGGGRYQRLVAVSRRIAQELTDHYRVSPDAIEIIPNGVNLERFFAEPANRAATRAALDLPASAPLLLFVGHEFGRKGLGFVLEALPHLPPETHLLVAGAGEIPQFRSQAQALGVAARVRFLGPRDDLPALYRAADAFVFPTAYEAFGLVCIEAMACGLPVFASASGGIEDYLQPGVNGAFVPRDGAGIAATLAPWLAEPQRLAALRAGAAATAQDYGWPRIASRYHRLLDQVQAHRASQKPSQELTNS